MSRRVLIWLTIGLAWSLVFWLVAWPMLIVHCAVAGLVLAVVGVGRSGLPRARAVDAAERTWRRYG